MPWLHSWLLFFWSQVTHYYPFGLWLNHKLWIWIKWQVYFSDRISTENVCTILFHILTWLPSRKKSQAESQKGINVVQWQCSVWEPGGRYRHRLCTAISPVWFLTEHLWMTLTPFWLSTAINCKLTCDLACPVHRPVRILSTYGRAGQDKNSFHGVESRLDVQNKHTHKKKISSAIFVPSLYTFPFFFGSLSCAMIKENKLFCL